MNSQNLTAVRVNLFVTPLMIPGPKVRPPHRSPRSAPPRDACAVRIPPNRKLRREVVFSLRPDLNVAPLTWGSTKTAARAKDEKLAEALAGRRRDRSSRKLLYLFWKLVFSKNFQISTMKQLLTMKCCFLQYHNRHFGFFRLFVDSIESPSS